VFSEGSGELETAGGRGGVVPANARIIGLIGEPPKCFGVSEWESVEQLQEYYKSPPRQALRQRRRRFIGNLLSKHRRIRRCNFFIGNGFARRWPQRLGRGIVLAAHGKARSDERRL